METIFHEQQEGSLCAQHCLNTLLQGQYFSPVDLADLAQQLDESERMQMAEGGVQTDEYQRFMQQASNNFDDSGFFSIQVIDKALQVWGLNLMQYNSQDAIARNARQNPLLQSAYICNFRDHWFTVRKLGYQWFNLNSLLTGPELISDTYLSLFLTQLQQEGYSIFIVTGRLPECEADDILRLAPAVQPVKPRLINENQAISKREEPTDVDEEMRTALEQSRELIDNDDETLQKALQMSMEGYVIEPLKEESSKHESSVSKDISVQPGLSTQSEAKQPSQEELRLKRLAFLNQVEKSSKANVNDNSTDKVHSSDKANEDNKAVECTEGSSTSSDKESEEYIVEGKSTDTEAENENDNAMSEEDMLKRAIQMSMEGSED